MVAQELLRVLAALPDPRLAVVDPRARFVEHSWGDAHVDESALTRDALAREELDLGDAKGRCDLVLDDLDLHAAADHHVGLLDRLERTSVDVPPRVARQRATARCWF